jgi:hypothetical protein
MIFSRSAGLMNNISAAESWRAEYAPLLHGPVQQQPQQQNPFDTTPKSVGGGGGDQDQDSTSATLTPRIVGRGIEHILNHTDSLQRQNLTLDQQNRMTAERVEQLGRTLELVLQVLK